MKKYSLFGIAVLLLLGCSDCGNKAVGTKQGDPLKWESIALGSNEASYKKALASLVQSELADIEMFTKCGDKLGIVVPDIDELIIQERTPGDHILSNCIFQSKPSRSPSPLIDIRGEFLDNKLVRLSYRLAPSECATLKENLTARFGEGLKATFLEQFLLTEESREYRIWTFGEIVWTLSSWEADTCLLTQANQSILEGLPKPAPASQKGKPVSLEDLGIGELNLKDPEPIAELKDASVP